jgi:hypothetical protein
MLALPRAGPGMFRLHQNSILRHETRHIFSVRSFIANCPGGRAAQRPGCCPAAGLLPSGRAAAPAHSSSEKLGGVKAPQQLSRSSGCIPRTTPHALDVSTSRLLRRWWSRHHSVSNLLFRYVKHLLRSKVSERNVAKKSERIER